MNHLYQILEESAANFPGNTALVFGEHRINYVQLKEACDRLADGLLKRGIRRGDRVAIILPNIPHFVFGYFSLLKIGAVAVPISILESAEGIHHRLQDAEIKGIIFWKELRSTIQKAVQGIESCRRLIVLDEKAQAGEVRLTYLIESHQLLTENINVSPDEVAVVSYASGERGRSFGVELTHRNIISNIESCDEFLRLMPDDIVFGVIPFSHMFGQTLVLCTFLRYGACVVITSRFSPQETLKLIQQEKATYLIGFPAFYCDLVSIENIDQNDLKSLKYALSVGDSLRQETMEAFESEFKISILEGYGLTEASPMVSINSPTRERKAGSIGLPLPGIDLKIIDDAGSEVKTGQVGEIVVQGPNVMKGYLNQSDVTAREMKGGWLHTGDLALLDESGFGFVVVQKKNVIIKSGFHIYPIDVEKVLYDHPKIKEAVVFGIADPTVGQEIIACVVIKPGEEATQEEIIEYAKERITAYKCPRSIYIVQSLPKGPTGRVTGDRLKQMLSDKMKL